MIIPSCLRVAVNGIISFSLMLSSISLYIGTTSSSPIHVLMDKHLGCFPVLAIVNSAAVNIGMHVFVNIRDAWFVQIYVQDCDRAHMGSHC